ncbi:MAG: NAD+ synthase [Bifidobacteriaceae bacterium]|jgi:NAD+ synthase (glutamine-hydrolysing)|nr:NAD+ synthase [Bifidobacteriaceae bacterium]
MKIALAQVNTKVADIQANLDKIVAYSVKAKLAGAKIVIFPEMTISGYPIKDLAQLDDFVKNCQMALTKLASQTSKTGQLSGCQLVLGTPVKSNTNKPYNCLAIIADGKVDYKYFKSQLPNYNEFDELRNYQAGNSLVIHYANDDDEVFSFCPLICEDIWPLESGDWFVKDFDLPLFELVNAVIVINSSPYNDKKIVRRDKVVSDFARRVKKDVIYVNQVGGEDNLIFDGSSFVVNNLGFKVLQMPSFVEGLTIYDSLAKNPVITSRIDQTANMYRAIVLSIYDYLKKNNFSKVIVGSSGGIDSSLVATLAVDALGSDNVKLVALPSKFSSKESVHDAKQLAYNLKTDIIVLPIDEYLDNFQNDLELPGLAYENIQSRLRGLILMSLANKHKALVLAPGNKSELAVGYSTLYGDTVGAFAPLKDIYKTQVYNLAKWRNNISNKNYQLNHIDELNSVKESKFGKALNKLIPTSVLIKEPSAELSPGQKDSDTLPDYKLLDKLLDLFIEKNKSVDEILERGFDSDITHKIAHLISNSEYKRQQYPPGPKLTVKSFGLDRRIPLDFSYTK